MNEKTLPETLREAVVFFSDEETCHNFLMQMRWPDGKPVCPHCGSQDVGKLVVSTREVAGRTLRSGKVVAPKTLTRRLWNCKGLDCKKQFSVRVGSLFEDSPLGLDKWLPAFWLIVNAKNGTSSHELARALGVTQKSAWFMGHRIRTAMKEGGFETMSGGIEADETFIGAKARNMHKHIRAAKIKGTGGSGKTAVMGLLERKVRDACSRVKVQVTKSTTKSALQGNVRKYVLKGSEIHTDALSSYRGLSDDYTHKVVDHAVAYVQNGVHTNGLENFWSLLKRTIKGTYVCPREFHLFRYLDEQTFRFNEREHTDRERFTLAVSSVANRRLTYRNLTGGTNPSEDV
jgi:transposase-like protein